MTQLNLTDTHAHLFWDKFQADLDSVIQHSLDAGVTTIVNVGTNLEDSKKALSQVTSGLLFERSQELTTFSTIGIHPHEAHHYLTTDSLTQAMEQLEKIYFSKPKNVIAVGECGLDYVFESNPDFVPTNLNAEQLKTHQQNLLTAHVSLAKKLNLPLLIHCREAWADIFKYISGHFGILHCFSADLVTAQMGIDNNFLISFPATITYPKNETLRQVAKTIPLEKIVLETDCPFLPPQSKRGQRNEPSTVREIAELIAELRSIPIEQVTKQTSENFTKLITRQ